MGLLPSIAIAGYWEHHPPEALIAGSRPDLRATLKAAGDSEDRSTAADGNQSLKHVDQARG